MSSKSTITLTRAEALELYHELRAKLYGGEFTLTDEELGNALDALREEECHRAGRPCFDNYLVERSE